jgi:FkbM family methyltransferase
MINNIALCIVDVGASGGINPKWKKLGVPVKAILFEPDPREYKNLKLTSSDDLIVLNSALTDKPGKIKLNLCKKQMVSSVYTPNFEFLNLFSESQRFEIVKKIEINADTLSNQLKKSDIKEVDFIKIDVQGYELSVLKGGGKYIESSIGLEIEVEFGHMYKNQPLFGDIDSFMTKKGFILFDLRRYFWKRKDSNSAGIQKGQLVFGDALYFKTPEAILNIPNITEEKVTRAICIYLTYGYIDLSQVLLDKSSSIGLLSKTTIQYIDDIIAKSKQESFFYFFKNNKISNLLKRMSIFFDKGSDYSGTDDAVGNK